LTKLAIDKAKYNVLGTVYTDKGINNNPYEMQIGSEKENLRWLL